MSNRYFATINPGRKGCHHFETMYLFLHLAKTENASLVFFFTYWLKKLTHSYKYSTTTTYQISLVLSFPFWIITMALMQIWRVPEVVIIISWAKFCSYSLCFKVFNLTWPIDRKTNWFHVLTNFVHLLHRKLKIWDICGIPTSITFSQRVFDRHTYKNISENVINELLSLNA